MPAKKPKQSPSRPIIAKKTEKKAAVKSPDKSTGKKAAVSEAKPTVKSGKGSGLAGGFTRVSETRIRKVY